MIPETEQTYRLDDAAYLMRTPEPPTGRPCLTCGLSHQLGATDLCRARAGAGAMTSCRFEPRVCRRCWRQYLAPTLGYLATGLTKPANPGRCTDVSMQRRLDASTHRCVDASMNQHINASPQ